ncbi:hypothetical protein V8C44DRAFT_319174 [Trichoderma aethiopicum]
MMLLWSLLSLLFLIPSLAWQPQFQRSGFRSIVAELNDEWGSCVTLKRTTVAAWSPLCPHTYSGIGPTFLAMQRDR